MGGGQPIKNSKTRSTVDVRELRANSLYSIDEKSVVRKSHENPTIKTIYKEFFGEPGSEVAHKYLHTKYKKQERHFDRLREDDIIVEYKKI